MFRVAARWVLWAVEAVHVIEAVELLRRRGRLSALPAASPGDGEAKVDVVGAVDDATRAAAAHELATTDARIVDLVPGDLPADRMLRLLRRVDPGRLGEDPFYTPGAAHEAVAIDPTVTA